MSTKLPPDPEHMNNDRAAWAGAAVFKFQSLTRTEHTDVLADLLCDLRHWADRQGMDWDSELRVAMMNYGAETSDEPVY